MADQQDLGINFKAPIEKVEEYKFEPIKGYPMLSWKGKRPFESTQFYPAQLKETHGEVVDGWCNRIYWGDNLQVMSHLLKEFRGKIHLMYIDPPFDSKADYKKQISLRGQNVANDQTVFEEKQYTDIWTNDEYLQFMYERLILMRELLHENGSIFVHCDYHKSHYIRCLLEEVFGSANFLNEIIWKRKQATSYAAKKLGISTDTIYWVAKGESFTFNPEYSMDDENTQKYIKERYKFTDDRGRVYKLGDLGNPEYRPNLVYEYKGAKPPANGWAVSLERMTRMDEEGRLEFPKKPEGRLMRRQFLDEYKGQLIQNLWLDIPIVNSQAKERLDYPTQKPEKLIERLIRIGSNPGDIVFDCFMGSGTAQSAAFRNGRRYIGADINLGAVQTTSKRLLNLQSETNQNPSINFSLGEPASSRTAGFQVFNVNYYDFFRNEVEAKDLLIKALEIQPLISNSIYDGEKDGRMVKIMPLNRIATRADLNELINNFDHRSLEKRQNEAPGKPVEHLLIVCMGHEPDLAAYLQNEMKPFRMDIEVVDILRDKSNLELKREAEAEIVKDSGKVVIKQFYPMNLLQKLSIEKQNVGNWKELVESVMIDFNYDGAIFEPKFMDIPEGNEMVKGSYEIPENAGTIRVKITDLLSESLEIDI